MNVDPPRSRRSGRDAGFDDRSAARSLDRYGSELRPVRLFRHSASAAAAVNYLKSPASIRADVASRSPTSTSPAQLGEHGCPDALGRRRHRHQRRLRSIARNRSTLNPDAGVPVGRPCRLRALRRFRSTATSTSYEFFGEIQIPIVQHSFIDDLSIGAGYRKSWYKLSNGRKLRHGHLQVVG